MKLTLREMFLLTVIVALVLAWWIDRTQLRTIANEMERKYDACSLVAAHEASQLQSHGYTFEWSASGNLTIHINAGASIEAGSDGLQKMRELMEELRAAGTSNR
jgi:hypothetical protein